MRQRVLMVVTLHDMGVSCVQGLRVHDNPALHAACRAGATLLPVFVLDPWFLKPAQVGINRLQFLLEALRDLDTRSDLRMARVCQFTSHVHEHKC